MGQETGERHLPRIILGGVEAFRGRDDGERGRGVGVVANGAGRARDARSACVSDAHCKNL